jgi:hypothetical protein
MVVVKDITKNFEGQIDSGETPRNFVAENLGEQI